jgi:hypothetical protein
MERLRKGLHLEGFSVRSGGLDGLVGACCLNGAYGLEGLHIFV